MKPMHESTGGHNTIDVRSPQSRRISALNSHESSHQSTDMQARLARASGLLAVIMTLAVSLAWCGQATASDEAFTPITSPTLNANSSIYGFEYSNGRILALVGEAYPSKLDLGESWARTTARISSDYGRSWSTVDWPAEAAYGMALGVSVAPDGAFWVTVRRAYNGPNALLELRPGATSWTMHPEQIPGYRSASSPGFDQAGRPIVATCLISSQTIEVWRLDPGTMTQIGSGKECKTVDPLRTFVVGDSVIVRHKHSHFKLRGNSLIDGVDERIILRSGSILMRPMSESIDGGARWIDRADGVRYAAVSGSESMALGSAGLRKLIDGKYVSRVDPRPPEDANRVYVIGGRTFALADVSTVLYRRMTTSPRIYDEISFWGTVPRSTLYEYTGPLEPQIPEVIGSPSAQAREFGAEVNRFRRASGLPAISIDELISKAAANHSAYWTMNPEPENPLDVHNETPGTPGFTGESPGERCEHVGTTCDGEVMYPSVSLTNAAGGWLVTVYHRKHLASPLVEAIGGADVDGGPSVASPRYGSRRRLMQPIGFPSGIWDGPLGFSGEHPSPTDACKENGYDMESSPGVTATAFMPEFASVTGIRMTRVGDGKQMKGCVLSNAFLPDGALSPGEEYRVDVNWSYRGTPTPGNAAEASSAFSWSFKTAGSAGGRRCKWSLQPARRAKARRITIKWRSCGASKLSVRAYRTKRAKKAKFSKTLRISRAKSGTTRIRIRKLSGRTYIRMRLLQGSRVKRSVVRRVTLRP